MAQIIRYVDPDAKGAGTGLDWTNAYTSLNTCMTTEAQNLTDGEGDYFTAYCRSSAGTADTTLCTLYPGWTTGPNNYIEIIGADFPVDGIFDSTKYVLHNNSGTAALYIREDYVIVRNLQILVTTSGTAIRHGLIVDSVGTSVIVIDSCIFKGDCSGTGGSQGIRINDSTCTAKIFNSLIVDFISGTDIDFYGVFRQVGSVTVLNSTVYNCGKGLQSVTATNCAVGACNDDFVTCTVNYCCSDDGDGGNAQGPLEGDWANEFNNIGGGNFSLKLGGNCIGNGTDDPGAGLYSDDIIGTARTSVWDIGAFEYVGAPPVAGRPMAYLFDLP